VNKKKLKMSNRAFRWILIPLLSLLTVVALLVNIAANALSSTLDTYVGAGETYLSVPKDKSDWDADYYSTEYTSNSQSTEAAYAVAQQVAEEGSILLKNNGILPLEKGSSVMPFGNAYLNPIYGQLSSGGSAKWVIDPVTPEQGLSAFAIDTSAVERMTAAGEPEQLVEAAGTKAAGEAGSILGGDCKIYEYDSAIYDGMETVSDTTGMVFITRSGQEGQDQKFDAYEDGTPHYLALSENEKGAIRAAKATCGNVVVILVSSAPMELSELMSGELEADAILWVGHPGERGFATLSDLLDGDVNPSGRTVDTYVADLTADPAYQSLGEYTYSNYNVTIEGYMPGSATEQAGLYNDYMEGVYMGYRYYETADEVDDSFVYGELDGKGAFVTPGAVCYPFGYGLSYTTFDQKLVGLVRDGDTITATVEVTNTGDLAGKEVVQLYYSAPYTDLDVQNKIEKPVCNLVAFDKTELLQPNESTQVTLTFTTDDMTSYCYTHANSDGTTGCYMLEAGDYVISLRSNSHDVIAEEVIAQTETIWYDGSDEDHIRQREKDAQSALDAEGNVLGTPADPDSTWVAATNQFQTSSDYMNTDSTILSRADWANTQPKAAEGNTKELSEEFIEQLGLETSFDVETDATLGNVEGSLVYAAEEPTSKAKNGLVLSELRGLDYYDPKWDDLLDQIDWDADQSGIIQNFAGDAYTTGAIASIGLPATVDEDGANGLKVNGVTEDGSGYDMTQSASFGFAPLMAATWNQELLYAVGAAFGQESIANGINGWYCPAINLHRSYFSGRVFEYYSEDPVLSGKLAAKVISGAGDQGMFCYVKHFALNETDTGRSSLISTWADEQTMRELYLKAFEIAIEEAKMTINYYDEDGNMTQRTMRAATAVMAAQNGVGTVVGECNYSLLTNVLRGEWGFQGMVISDYWVWGDNSLRDLAIRAGCDSYLCMFMPAIWTVEDYDSATARTAMRNAIHNIAYAVVNSNAMQGYAPGTVQKTTMSPWLKALIGADVVIALIVLGGIFWIVKRTKAEKAHPELYKRKVKKTKTK
jgi:beta-glucosidase